MAALHRPVTAAGHSPERAAGVGDATSLAAHINATAATPIKGCCKQNAVQCYPKILLGLVSKFFF
jgi:hypothetical protein